MSNKTQSNGIGVVGLLGVAFVVLKLTNFIDWSWWYVTAPFWGGLVLGIVILLVSLIIAVVAALISK